MNNALKEYITKNHKENCCEEVHNSNVKFQDKHSDSFMIENNNQNKVYKVKIDGCLIDNVKIKKCDFIACTDNDRVVLIELKSGLNNGSYAKNVLEQFLSTLKEIKITKTKTDCYCILVSSKSFPKPRNQQQFYRLMVNNFGKGNHEHFTKQADAKMTFRQLFGETNTTNE